MKTKEKLNALKEVETSNKKLVELSDEELAQVTGGEGVPPVFGPPVYEPTVSPEENFFA